MRSSASTPSPSAESPVTLFLWIVGEDHPKACTGRRLAARGLVRTLAPRAASPAAILLDPHAADPISRADAPRVHRAGLAAVDCSWNRLGERGRYPSGGSDSVPAERRRRLPWLLAGNAQHYGRLSELNTAEALAAALFVVGARQQAVTLLEATGAGRSFERLNAELLTRYAAAKDPEGVRQAESEFF
ncbi:MAG: DUF367 domain-containing protein [Thermoplasmata archaeon]|nr:DUF367 domain-containing protein [Thermoplasmata archaeon]